MLNEFFVGRVSLFQNGNPDKNGNMPVIIVPVAGKCPNRNVISGTVAANMGLDLDKTYLFSVREVDPDEEYGRRFVFTPVSELSGSEVLEASFKLGPGTLLNVSEPESNKTNTGTENVEAKKTLLQ